jgi:hypothetical protein
VLGLEVGLTNFQVCPTAPPGYACGALFLLARQIAAQAVTRVTVKRRRLSDVVFERSSAVVLGSRADTAIRRPGGASLTSTDRQIERLMRPGSDY